MSRFIEPLEQYPCSRDHHLAVCAYMYFYAAEFEGNPDASHWYDLAEKHRRLADEATQ